MSDAFAYLSVLLSIILGLAIAEVLQGYGSLLLSRSKVKLYAPPLIWSVMMLMMATQFWWASFGLAEREHWDFAAFSAVLLQTVMMYMGAAVVLPKGRSDEPIDLKAHYYREATPFFTFGLLFLVVGFVKDWLLDQSFVRPWSLHFMAFFTAMTALALVVRKPVLHEIIAPVMAIAITVFFLFLFMRL
jgi:hypothetical protein